MLSPSFASSLSRGVSLALAAFGLLSILPAAPSTPVVFPPTRLKASDPATWRRVPFGAEVPTSGVTLSRDGLLRPAVENNIAYLLSSFSVQHMLVPFRMRAGNWNPPADRAQVAFWDTDLRGANAGRFMMGAGNTLRWIEHAELRRRLDELIDGIEACREPNGYIMAFPPGYPRSEEPNYGRAWFTHGLIEAGLAGNPKAFPLLRGHADWFNQWNYLPQLLYHAMNSHQGHIASTRTYLSPIGKPEDLQVAEKYYVADWWIDGLAARNPEAIWKYPLQNPHSYLITTFEAYLDHYIATGDRRFLDAITGAWEMIHLHWQHVGGSMAICESHWQMIDGEYRLPVNVTNADLSHGQSHPPGSYFLTRRGHTGETCGSVFWMKLNQRFHQLRPEEEKFAGEIEKSIYNVLLANQQGGHNIRYHAVLQGQKENGNRNRPPAAPHNTCCEGQGTRAYGSLPEYVYSRAADGVYVNLFEPSEFAWRQGGDAFVLEQSTRFPFEPRVALRIKSGAARSAIRVRIPGWAAGPVAIRLNGREHATGQPGSYLTLDRVWRPGDTIEFTLPMAFRVTRYTGIDQIPGRTRFAVEYGPILLAFTGALDEHASIDLPQRAADVARWLKPVTGRPLHFEIAGHTAHQVMPYWLVDRETFTVYPTLRAE